MPLRRKFIKRRRPTVRKTRLQSRRTLFRRIQRPLRIGLGIPQQHFVKLRYTDFYQALVSASSTAAKDYRLNSLYDPDTTAIGGQPYYFDQWSAMYERYRVYGCKIEITASCASSTSNLYHPILALSTWATSAPGWSTMANMLNAKGVTYKPLIPGEKGARIVRYVDLRKLAAVSKNQYDTDMNYAALVAANPAQSLAANVSIFNNDGGSSVAIQWYVRLTFYAKMFDPVEPAAS